ncbi:MAG: hypothetical protein ACPG5B_10335 [Chitinophagales bacterium]
MRFFYFFICIFFISCTLNVVKKTSLETTKALSIDELFLLLPKEAFYINEIQQIISSKERQIILESTTGERAVALSSNFLIDTSQSSNSFLKFTSFANDEGIAVSLKTWEREDKSIVVGVNITISDMCCEYSKLNLFHYKNAAFRNVTKKIFPKLRLEDFVTKIDAKTKALLPTPIELTIYCSPDNDFLELSIDHTPMLYDLEDNLTTIEQKLKLFWKNDSFVMYEN